MLHVRPAVVKAVSKGAELMERIRHELTGYIMPSYIEEILTCNYCRGFIKMNMVKEHDSYRFSYKPGAYKRLDYRSLGLYEKLILIRAMISIAEKNKEHLINPEIYLFEPELIYTKDNNVSVDDIRLMFYPDIKLLSFRYKLVLFADRILNKKTKEEREAADHIRQISETGDVNRVKLMLDKQIMRLENRMIDSRYLS